MITHSDSIKAISNALLAFQGAVDGVGKNGNNPHFKSRYATLENVRDTAVPELQKVGLVYVQTPGPIMDGCMSFTTMIVHPESGEWMKLMGDIPLGKKDPQGAGSAITYMSRYSLMAALGLPAVDDDGEGATSREAPPAPTVPKSAGRPLYDRLSKANRECVSLDQFNNLWGHKDTLAAYQSLPADWKTHLDEEKADKFAELDERAAMQADNATPTVAPNFDNLIP